MGASNNLDTWEPRGVRQPLFQSHDPSCVTPGLMLSLSELQVLVKMEMVMPYPIPPCLAHRMVWPEAEASLPQSCLTFGHFKRQPPSSTTAVMGRQTSVLGPGLQTH